MDSIWIVVPCYNEEAVLQETGKRLLQILSGVIEKDLVSNESVIAFVNDGSSDDTWKLITEFCETEDHFVGINLSRNEGHQKALLAGLSVAVQYADAIITIDADLQDDISVIEKFILAWKNGFDIVYGVRSSRRTDSWFKRFSAESYYRIMRSMGVELVFNHADFRLMSNRAVSKLFEFNEANVFLRGLIPQIGFPSTIIEYERKKRNAGKTKYSIRKMCGLAEDGLISFSTYPLNFIFFLGGSSFLVGLTMVVYHLVCVIIGTNVADNQGLMETIWLLGGVNLLSLGVIGKYVGKILMETKHRPKFIIDSIMIKDRNKKTD